MELKHVRGTANQIVKVIITSTNTVTETAVTKLPRQAQAKAPSKM
jgi:hypothetical protein